VQNEAPVKTPFLFVALAIAGGGLFACAPPVAAQATLTSADVARAPSAAEIPATREVAEASEGAPDSERPPGERACRMKRASGTTELFLDWEGGSVAKGVLRTVTPSGMIHLQRVRAERYKGMIFADDPADADWDLVCHTAVIAQRDGKPYMRIGEGDQPWSACE
jgi:hypothetical protein